MDARRDDDADSGDLTGEGHPSDGPPPPQDGPAPRDDDAPGTRPAAAEDEVWASLVARLTDGPDAAPARPLPAPTPVTPREDASPVEDAPADDAPAPVPAMTGRDWDGTSQYGDAEDAVDDLEHFVPEDPGPVITGGDPLLTLAWGAAVGAPLLLLVVVVAWRDAPVLLVRVAVVVFLVAVAVLVWRMPQRREPSDDDGAVV